MDDYTITVGDSSIDVTYVTNSVAIYNCLVDVVRSTKVNGPGGITPNTSTIVTNMPCNIKWLSGKESIKFNKQAHTLDGILSCRVPVGVTIKNTDKIIYNGVNYEIVNVEDVSNLGLLLNISIKKIK